MFQAGYFHEFRRHWLALLAATVGLAGGAMVNQYAQAIFAPKLLAEFGWSQSHYALLSLASIPAVLLVPLAGRLADVFGTRRTVLPGIVLYPFTWLAFTLVDGSFTSYVAALVLHVCTGMVTSSIVYSRIIAEHFQVARGLALSIMMSGPSIAVAIGAPFLTRLVDAQGWQPGYVAMSVYSALVGGTAYLLMRRMPPPPVGVVEARNSGRDTRADFAAVFRSRTFWIIFCALLLCNVPNLLHSTQIKLMLLDRGLSLHDAARIISLYAVGVIVGRFACGLALDRLPIVPVAVTALILPALGLFLVGAQVGGFWTMGLAMAMVGLAQGAEGELAAMLVLKHFRLDLFGTVFGLLTVNTVLATAIGSLLLSRLLAIDDSFTAFILVGAATTLVGSLLLTLLGGREKRQPLASPA